MTWTVNCNLYSMLININAQVPADAQGDNTDDDSNLINIKAENILNRLLLCGNYENIIKNIFKYLNATQLACLQKVPLNKQTLEIPSMHNCDPQTCESWAQFIDSSLWSDPRTLDKLRTRWATFMPKCFVIAHSRPIISLACTPA